MQGKLPANCYRRRDTIWGRIVVAGHEYRASLRTSDPREAAARLKAWRQKLERFALGVESQHTFKAAVVRWSRETLPSAVKPSVVRRYLASIKMLDDVFGKMRLGDITTQRIAEYIASRTGTVSNATIRRDLTALSRLLSACIAWGWISDNPARVFDRSIIRERQKALTIPTDPDLDAVVAACPATMGTILRLLDETGMREMEAVRLERAAVDFGRQQIVLRHTKSGRPRTLNWRTPGGDAGLVLRHHPVPLQTPYLFPHSGGAPYAQFASDFGNVIRRVVASETKAGREFRRFRVHDLRHRFAIRWLKAGGDIYRLSRHLGHTSVKTTEGYLRYLTDDELDAVMGVSAQKTAQSPKVALE